MEEAKGQATVKGNETAPLTTRSAEAVSELLVSLFSDRELRRFVTSNYSPLALRIRWRESVAQQAFEFVELLQREGLYSDSSLYELLRELRPSRQQDIDAVERFVKREIAASASLRGLKSSANDKSARELDQEQVELETSIPSKIRWRGRPIESIVPVLWCGRRLGPALLLLIAALIYVVGRSSAQADERIWLIEINDASADLFRTPPPLTRNPIPLSHVATMVQRLGLARPRAVAIAIDLSDDERPPEEVALLADSIAAVRRDYAVTFIVPEGAAPPIVASAGGEANVAGARFLEGSKLFDIPALGAPLDGRRPLSLLLSEAEPPVYANAVLLPINLWQHADAVQVVPVATLMEVNSFLPRLSGQKVILGGRLTRQREQDEIAEVLVYRAPWETDRVSHSLVHAWLASHAASGTARWEPDDYLMTPIVLTPLIVAATRRFNAALALSLLLALMIFICCIVSEYAFATWPVIALAICNYFFIRGR